MTQEEQLTEFTRKICKAVEYSDMEYDLTTEQMIGVLEVAKQMIIAKFLNECFASVTGLGNWMLDIDMLLKVGISMATLIYIILKIKQLLKNG